MMLGMGVCLVGCPPATVGPTAAFTTDVSEGAAPLDVAFTDTSTAGTSAITSWAWTFDDGGTSTSQSPSHTFDDPGTYTVSLTVTTDVGSDTATADITVTEPPNVAPKVSIKVLGLSHFDIEEAGFAIEPTSGLNNVPVETYALLEAEAIDPDGDPVTWGDWQLVSKPEGSMAGFESLPTAKEHFDPGSDLNVALYVDLEGTYEVEITASDGVTKATTTAKQVINAGTWVGAGIVHTDTDPPTLSASDCTGCHNASGSPAPDMFTPWLQTGHATMVAVNLDAEGGHYNTNCLECHTVGWNPDATNGAFDDLLATSDWMFPEVLEPGNWQNLIDTDPELAALANIQCENCHGPASQHLTSAFGPDPKMGVSLGVGVCGQCHGEPPRHAKVQEWEISGHSDEDSEAFAHWEEDDDIVSSSCARCHSGFGFITFAKGEEEGEAPKQVHTCSVCHDPHSVENEYQLRVVDSTEIPITVDGSSTYGEVDGLGTSATCVTCHNGRRTPAAMVSRFSTPHYLLGGVMMLGVNGVDYGIEITDSFHAQMFEQTVTMGDFDGKLGCAACHMAVSTPDGANAGVTHEYEYKVGQHTFNLADEDYENVEMACATCHAGLDTLNRTARADYDGNGATEGIQDEVQGLLTLLHDAAVAAGAVDLGSHPYWNLDGVSAEDLDKVKNALWNYEYVKNDASGGVHNTAYSVSLLQISYYDLTGADVPGATIRTATH